MGMLDASFDVDKLTYEIFSILENKFLFYRYDDPKLAKTINNQTPIHQQIKPVKNSSASKVRILSIEGGGATNDILIARSLYHLESCLRKKFDNPNSSISDYFNVVAESGAGGILAALLFTRAKNGSPMFTAGEALSFLVENRRKSNKSEGFFGKMFMQQGKLEKALVVDLRGRTKETGGREISSSGDGWKRSNRS